MHVKQAAKFFGVILISTALIGACGKKKPEASAYQQYDPFPYLGKSATFAVLSGTQITNTGTTTVYGDLGVSPGTEISGLSTLRSTGGEIHKNSPLAIRAQQDSQRAFNNLRDKGCDQDLSGRDLGGLTLAPGTYCFTGDANLSGLLTLDARNDIKANFIFQVGQNLNTSPGAGVRMLNNGETCNVFWQVSNSATVGASSNFMGGILAVQNVTMNLSATLNGKVSSRNGAVSLNGNEIYNNFCPWPGN